MDKFITLVETNSGRLVGVRKSCVVGIKEQDRSSCAVVLDTGDTIFTNEKYNSLLKELEEEHD